MSVLLDVINPRKTDYVDRKFKGSRVRPTGSAAWVQHCSPCTGEGSPAAPPEQPGTWTPRARPQEKYFETLAKSTTLYIGNLSFFTTEEQIHELFSRAGDVRRIIMGLDAVKKTPCGFCFVIFYARK